MVFGNRVLKTMFGPRMKWQETGGSCVMSLITFTVCQYNYNDQIKKYEIGSACSMIWKKRNASGIFLGKPEGKRQLGRPGSRWVENNKIDNREIGWGSMDWNDFTQDRNN
jgi:hypothetical protein